ncbi:prepilin peptidase [Staphylococcus sp. Mo2-7]
MIKQLLLCPVLFSYLYQLSHVNQLRLKYFTLRSRCDYCQSVLKFTEMIPILSFLCLKGRSSCCQSKLSSLYLIGELLSIVPRIYTFLLIISFRSHHLYTYIYIPTCIYYV